MSLVMSASLTNVMCGRVCRRSVCDILFYFSVLFSLFCFSVSDNLMCQLSNSCWCANSEGYGVNFSSVNQWYSYKADNWTFYFHPCLPPATVPAEPRPCPTGASVCAQNMNNGSYIDLGFENETVAHTDDWSKPIQLTFQHHGRLTNIRLDCDQSSSAVFFNATPSQQPYQYDLLLASPTLCLHKLVIKTTDTPPVEGTSLSTGSVLVILFFFFTTLYFVGGALVLKLLRGAEGKEMIPNYDFWVSLPGLVKEGFLFAVSGCQTPQAYDRI